MSTTKPEALRLAEGLESIFISEEIHATKAQKIAAELRRLHARIAELESQLVKEAARSADEKRRADQMTEQHRMQAALNTEARAQLAERAAQESAIGAGGVSPLMGAAGDAGWVTLPGKLPESGKPVLLDIGKKHPIRALWAPKFTLPTDGDVDYGEYDEATDDYYCHEGWYEWNEHEEAHWRVTSTPVAWCAMPAPSSAKGVAHG